MKEKLLKDLEKITKTMNVPDYRRTSVTWLSKNMGIKNSDHPKYKEAVAIMCELNKLGVY